MRAVLTLLVMAFQAYGMNLRFAKRAATGGSPVREAFDLIGSLAAGDEDGPETISNVQDVRYTTNIRINGVEVHVALDTGSTDLWVGPPEGIGSFNDTGIPLELLYGDGTYGVSGTIGVAPFEFGDYQIPRQAFLNAVKSNVQGLTEHGVNGLLGLSFNFASASPINRAIQNEYGTDATWGHSVLQNIFDQHPDQPNFIALDLARTDDLEETAGGSFGIGEYDDDYAGIIQAPKLAQYPRGGDRWTTLLEGVSVDGAQVELKPTIQGVPEGHSIALLDTGDPTAIVPVYLLDEIYSRIPGSVPYTIPSTNQGVWLVPCNTTVVVAFKFGGQEFPIHPLDLTRISKPLHLDNGVYSSCVSAFQGADNWGRDEYEISLGDSFLRNVYSLFDFGDQQPDGTLGEPYMQLLSQIDSDKAKGQVSTIRTRTMADHPPEMEPSALVDLLGVGAKPAGSTASKNVIRPSGTGVPQRGGSSESTSNALSQAMIALLAVNTFIGLVLVVFVVMLWFNFRRRSSPWDTRSHSHSKSNQTRYVPLSDR